MKDYIEERVIELAHYILETNATVRAAAKKFKVSKSTVHTVLTIGVDCIKHLNMQFKNLTYK